MKIDKDTVICASLSARPSNFGTRFHNFLYEQLELNWLYKGFAVTDIENAIRGIRALGFRGCAVSMPHKEAVMSLIDEVDPIAREIGAVNTIVNDQGYLKGFNTDWVAVRDLVRALGVPPSSSTVLLGSGGMAKAIGFALKSLNFTNVTVVSRNEEVGGSLAKQLGFMWRAQVHHAEFLLNATPIGMAPQIKDSPFDELLLKKARYVLDSVAAPSETKFIQTARSLDLKLITGFDIVVLQAREQFRLYTGREIPESLAVQAANHART